MGERSILSYNNQEQIIYLQQLFFMQDTEKVLFSVLKHENLNLEISNLIMMLITNKKVRKHLKTINGIRKDKELEIYIHAMIISILNKLSKPRILSEFIKNLSKSQLNKIYIYERIDNQQILNKYTNHTNIKLKPKKKITKIWIIIVMFIIILVSVGMYFWVKDMKLLKYYQDKVYPNFYIYDVDISEKKHEELDDVIKNIENNIKEKEIVFKYNTEQKKYKLADFRMSVESNDAIKKLKDYNNLSYKEKLQLIKSNENHKLQLNITYDKNTVDKIVEQLKKQFNKKKKEGSLNIDNKHNVKYNEGHDGFTLDEKTLHNDIIKVLENPIISEKELNIELTGEIVKRTKTDDSLKQINKKVASYTTYFANYGPRGHNITLAASKANGTILQPGEVFSYRKVVGPYNRATGYQSAPIQQNGGTAYASGGGVCQLTTTIFNAQLLAGLETVYRTNHGAPVAYAPRGMDATVYGDSVDYKFKNSYKYPVYISVYTTATTLTVDIWSNENAMGNKTYKPYVVAKNRLEYLTYLAVYKDGKQIETKYIGYSYYLK